MGIKSNGCGRDEWRGRKVKHWSDVVNGEHWRDFGFRFAEVDDGPGGKQ